jgi:hypothetical protein
MVGQMISGADARSRASLPIFCQSALARKRIAEAARRPLGKPGRGAERDGYDQSACLILPFEFEPPDPAELYIKTEHKWIFGEIDGHAFKFNYSTQFGLHVYITVVKYQRNLCGR